MSVPMSIHMLLVGQYNFDMHIYVRIVPKLLARQYMVCAFPYCFYLAPLTSSVGLLGQFQ